MPSELAVLAPPRNGQMLWPESDAIPELREALENGTVQGRDAAQIIKKPAEIQLEALAKVKNGQAPNLIAAANAIDRQKIAANVVEFPTGIYSTIVIDPPWPLTKIRRKVRPNQEGFDYPTMSLEEIAGLAIKDLLADDAFVFLWTTQKYLPCSFKILEGWGLTYRFTMVWHKPGGIQPLNSPQFNAEFVVTGSQGRPKFADLKAFNVAFNAPRAGHSVKPEGFYEVLRRVTAAPRLDMFSRRQIQGFKTWGNQNDSSSRDEPGPGEAPLDAGAAQHRLH